MEVELFEQIKSHIIVFIFTFFNYLSWGNAANICYEILLAFFFSYHFQRNLYIPL